MVWPPGTLGVPLGGDGMPLRRVHGVPEGARGRPGVLCGLPRGAEPVCGQPFCVPDAVCVLQGALAAPGAGADLGHRGG
eukprot:11135699-Prorocentrum_lima.AAC.1